MRSINKVFIIGNVTRDPELKTTVSGQPIATFGLATNRDWMTRDGGRHTSSEFHEVIAWSKLAEICSKYITKGKLVYIEGYLKTRSWDGADGTKRHRTEIVINDLIMLDKRAKSDTTEEMTYEEMPSEGQMSEDMPQMDSENF